MVVDLLNKTMLAKTKLKKLKDFLKFLKNTILLNKFWLHVQKHLKFSKSKKWSVVINYTYIQVFYYVQKFIIFDLKRYKLF